MIMKFNLFSSSPSFCSLRYEKLGKFEGFIDINGHLDMATEIGNSLLIPVYLDKLAKEIDK